MAIPATGALPGAGGDAAPPASAAGGQGTGRDPTLFTWPEGNPDGGVKQLCKPGHYVGAYQCKITLPPQFGAFSGDAGSFSISGPVDLTLNQGQSGEFLTVSGGTLKSTAQGIFALAATVVGQLDCQTGVFSGQLVGGEVSIPPFPPGGTFDGTLNAAFDPRAAALEGHWTLVGGTTFTGIQCTGPWNATYQGP
jgi:hypothetical protein